MRRTSPSWYRVDFDGLTAGLHTVEVKAQLDFSEPKNFHRKIDVVVAAENTGLPRLKLTKDKTTYKYGETAKVRIEAVSESDEPIANLPVVLTYANHLDGGCRTVEGKTDRKGIFRDEAPLFVKPSYITVGAGADAKPYGVPFRMTDAVVIQIWGAAPENLDALVAGKAIETFDFHSDSAWSARQGRVFAASEAVFAIEREVQRSYDGLSALSLSLKPANRDSWGFAEFLFPKNKDLSESRAVSMQLLGDGSDAQLKLMLIDEDGERWFDEPVDINFRGWQEIRFSLRQLQRDPSDGVNSGDGRPNLNNVSALACILNAKGGKPVKVVIDDLRELMEVGSGAYRTNIGTAPFL